MGVKSTYDIYANWGTYKKAAVVGLIAVTLILVWSSDYGNTNTTTNY